MSQVGVYLDRIRALAPTIMAHADQSERDAQIAPPVVEAFHEAGLFRMLLPAAMGGGDLTLAEAFQTFEEVARSDGSAAWNLSICAGGPLFGHFLARDAYEHVFADPRAVSAGSLNPLGVQAVRDSDDWRFTGRATYVSGSGQATWLMTAGFLLVDGAPRLVDGIPEMRATLLPMREARVLSTWDMAGMRATGSNDCVFENVHVPDAFTFGWPDPRSTWKDGAFGGIPLPVQLGGGFAAVALGVARHALDELVSLAVDKRPAGARATLRERALAQTQLGQAEGLLGAARAYFYSATDEVWRRGTAREPFDDRARANARLASVTAVKLAAQAVDLVHDAAGMNAMRAGGVIQRCWRDVHTITQHVVMNTGRFEVVGRILFGLPAGTPII